MKIAFYDTKPYDHIWFDKLAEEYNYEIKFFENKLTPDTTILADGCDVVCVFVNDTVDEEVIKLLHNQNVGLIAMRGAGYNHIDLKAAYEKMKVVRVPEYSPSAVSEHAIALLMTLNRKTHRAYVRTRDNNFSINGLVGMDLRGKTIGVIGTGKIGVLFAESMQCFGMNVLAYDLFPKDNVNFKYVSLDELFCQSDVISLHCPLTPETRHMINDENIAKMKDGVILINTSRGGLIDTDALITGIKSHKIGGAGLDVYEEEENYFFEDLSDEIIADDDLTKLLSYHNVLVTSHQAFFTKEAIEAIARVTMENINEFENRQELKNEVYYNH